MSRRFNTAGPNDPEEHHTLPLCARLPDVRRLIDEKLYFAVHAPRQAGKTTALLTLARELTREGLYGAVVVSMDGGAPFHQELGMAEDGILDAWRAAASRRLPPGLRPPPWSTAPPGRRISCALQAWAEHAPRPLVVLLDDAGTAGDMALASALRQIRDGFPDRPHHFPWSLAVAGLRDVPDPSIAAAPGEPAGASPLDIMSESITLHDFTRDEVGELYGAHTDETGQVFLPAAIDRAFELTQGQPWLVNALARQLVEVLVPDRATAITAAGVFAAAEILVRRHETHFDALAERLREPPVRALLEWMLAGEALEDVPEEDRRLAIDLGLVRRSAGGGIEIANPIYRRVLARVLGGAARASMLPVMAKRIPDRLDEEPLPDDGALLPEAAPDHATALSLVPRTEESVPDESWIQQERLDEWFLPVSEVLADAVALPSAPPGANVTDHEATETAPDRRGRGQRILRNAMLAGAACVLLVATIARIAGGIGAAVTATPRDAAASAPATAVDPMGTPVAAPAPSATIAAPAPASAEPMPGLRASAESTRAPARAPSHANIVEPRPVSRVVPSLPPLPPPDEARMRPQLESKVWSGEGSIEEIRMLKAICSRMGDHDCRDRAYEMLKKKQDQ